MLLHVHNVADPSPLIEERLRLLAAEHAPRITALEQAIRTAQGAELKGLKDELVGEKRSYRAAQRDVRRLRGPSIAW
jgi:hypothetical protein